MNTITLPVSDHRATALDSRLGWIQRRSDRQFPAPDQLATFLRQRSEAARTVIRPNAEIELRAHDRPQSVDQMNELSLTIDGREIDFTHWSFGQVAQLAKAPAGFLRTLPGQLVRDTLEYSLRYNREVEEVKFYHDANELRAVTGPGYGRVDDFEVVEAVQSILDLGRWVPAKDHMGLRVTDRSLNMFLIDRSNPIVIGRAPDGSDDVVWRGLRIANSEVGSASLTVEGFTFRSYCLNGMIFGMQEATSINIRHSKNAPGRWAREVQPAIERYAAEDNARFVDAVNDAKQARVAADNDAALNWLNNRGLSRSQARTVVENVQKEEGRDPRTVWDMVQGITAAARNIAHVDDRADLERLAGKLFARAA